MSPTPANGKICYIEIPATEIAHSSEFYKRVFGWTIRKRDDGSTAFDDTVGEVSGTWVRGRSPASEPGLLVYIMVDSVAATLEVIVANGGRDRAAARRGRARDHCEVPRPGRKPDRPVSGTRLKGHG
jgi:predicted enzyme related to lactoylglutathione lyase